MKDENDRIKRIFHTRSSEETEQLASRFANRLREGDIIGLIGEMGAGKTCFVRGLVHGLSGGDCGVNSPTYALVNHYAVLPAVAHFDLYRVNGFDDLESTGFWDVLTEEAQIIVVEWADRIEDVLALLTCRVTLNYMDEYSREIWIEGDSERVGDL
jgi:tRNA threonylcarbamoyladenosine biosynthesis protein TsaE